MFDKPFYDRLKCWKELRYEIETAKDPFSLVLDFWRSAPATKIATDPYDSETWPDPWAMIEENQYCDFMKILAIFYTLQLTERFSESEFEIHIFLDQEECSTIYLLSVDKKSIGYYNESYIARVTTTFKPQAHYNSLPTYT
jgi:hypothetical protein